MEHRASIKYDRNLVIKALNLYFFRTLKSWTWMVSVVGLLVLFYAESQKNWSFLHSIIGILLIVYFLLLVFIYLVRYKGSDSFLRRSKEAIVEFVFSPEEILMKSDLAETKMKWELVDGIIKSKELWLLIYSKSGYLTLPVSALSEECKKFLDSKAPTV